MNRLSTKPYVGSIIAHKRKDDPMPANRSERLMTQTMRHAPRTRVRSIPLPVAVDGLAISFCGVGTVLVRAQLSRARRRAVIALGIALLRSERFRLHEDAHLEQISIR